VCTYTQDKHNDNIVSGVLGEGAANPPPQQLGGLGSAVSSPSGVRGGAPATNRFSHFGVPRTALLRNMRPLSMREDPPTGGYGGSFLRLCTRYMNEAESSWNAAAVITPDRLCNCRPVVVEQESGLITPLFAREGVSAWRRFLHAFVLLVYEARYTPPKSGRPHFFTLFSVGEHLPISCPRRLYLHRVHEKTPPLYTLP